MSDGSNGPAPDLTVSMPASRTSGTSCRQSPMRVLPLIVTGNAVDLSKVENVPVGSFRDLKTVQCNLTFRPENP